MSSLKHKDYFDKFFFKIKIKTMKNLLFIVVIIFTANLTQAQWGADVRLTNDPAVSAAATSGGIASNVDSIHVVWYDERDGNREIYYKRSTDGGQTWGADTRLTTNDSVSKNPAIAISGSYVHIVWDDKRDGNREIYYKRSTDGGTTWGGDIRLTNATDISYCPGIAVSGSNVHIIWTDLRDGNGNKDIYYKFSTDGGITWGNDTRITNDAAMSYNTSISVSGSNVHFIWEDTRDGNREIYYKRSTDGGLNWGTDTRLTNNSSARFLPTSAVSGSNLYIVWNDYRNGNYEIYFKHSADAGLTWGADTRLTNAAGNSWWATVAASASGVHIAWHDDRNGNAEIFYMYSLDEGLSWSSDTLLVNNSATMSERPSIALSGSAVHLNWQDKRDGPNGEIYYKRNPTGNFIGIKESDYVKNDINIYPNPASDNITISFSNAELSKMNILIYNSLGVEIKRFEEMELVGENAINFSIESFPTGIYYCTLNYGTKKISRSFVVLR